MNEPSKITAGDSLSWEETLSGYPASEGWVLNYTFVNASGRIEIASTADGDTHSISKASSVTSSYPPGEYTLVSYVTKDAERYTIAKGTIIVEPNLADMQSYDARTQNKKILDEIEAAILRVAEKGEAVSITINGRAATYRSVDELLKLKSHYAWLVESEKNKEAIAEGKAPGGRRLIQFVNP